MVLIVAIIGMIIIMVRERNRVLVIETEAQTIHRVQHNGNIVQHHITILSTYGETALSIVDNRPINSVDENGL
jgi:hypothetical protein